jgi:magnesium transporter
MSIVVACAAYEGGSDPDIDIEQAGCVAPGSKGFVWIGLHEPDEALLQTVQARFGLHDLAIEDAHLAHQLPASTA